MLIYLQNIFNVIRNNILTLYLQCYLLLRRGIFQIIKLYNTHFYLVLTIVRRLKKFCRKRNIQYVTGRLCDCFFGKNVPSVTRDDFHWQTMFEASSIPVHAFGIMALSENMYLATSSSFLFQCVLWLSHFSGIWLIDALCLYVVLKKIIISLILIFIAYNIFNVNV